MPLVKKTKDFLANQKNFRKIKNKLAMTS